MVHDRRDTGLVDLELDVRGGSPLPTSVTTRPSRFKGLIPTIITLGKKNVHFFYQIVFFIFDVIASDYDSKSCKNRFCVEKRIFYMPLDDTGIQIVKENDTFEVEDPILIMFTETV